MSQRQKRLMAIHDISCVGRCSLTVALPILSAAGFDTGVLPTAVLSTHTGGFDGFTYRDLTEDIAAIADHWAALGLHFDALYSGFLGSIAQIDLLSDLFARFRSKDTLILVDPVMADNGVLYSVFTPEMARGMARLCAQADIIVPNLTEAAFLLGQPYREGPYNEAAIKDTARRLAGLGPRAVVLTGAYFAEDHLGAAAYDAATDTMSYAFSKRVAGHFHGTGDVFSSVLLAGLMHDRSLGEAARIAVDTTYASIAATVVSGQERRYGVCFERALPFLMERLGIGYPSA